MPKQEKQKQPDFDKRLRDLERRVELLEWIEETRRMVNAKVLRQLDREMRKYSRKSD